MFLPLFWSGLRRWPVLAKPSPVRLSVWSSVVAVSLVSHLAFQKPITLEASHPTRTPQDDAKAEPHKVDPDTSIAFPLTLRVPAKQVLPPLTLLGVGVRTVSFLGIKVYSIGFYADMSNPSLKLSPSMTSEEKVEHIIKNTSCLVRIIPTRSTGFTHLRDGFVRALQARLSAGKVNNTISEQLALDVAGPIRELKTMFPNVPLPKHTPLDVYLAAPSHNHPRSLTIRDMGAVEDNWVATQFFLLYFDQGAPSPRLKKNVFEALSI